MKTTDLRIENDYTGYLEAYNGKESFDSYTEAVNALHETIKTNCSQLLDAFPKAKWGVGYMDKETERWVELYSISSSRVKKLMSANML